VRRSKTSLLDFVPAERAEENFSESARKKFIAAGPASPIALAHSSGKLDFFQFSREAMIYFPHGRPR